MKPNSKIRLYIKHTPVKNQDGTFSRKTSYFVECAGMLKPVYLRPEVRNVGYSVNIPADVFAENFQFEPPIYNKGASNSERDDQ